MTYNHKYTVGIDPGKHTAIAVYNRELKCIIDIINTDFCGCLEFFQKTKILTPLTCNVVVELPNSKHVWHTTGQARGSIERTAFHVGMVYGQSELLVEWLMRQGYKVITQHPQGKKDAETVKKITGYTGSTNEHTRDAIMLCWGL